MDLNQVFPSKYIKAADLQGREVPVTIRQCVMEKLDDGNKLVIYFNGKEKGMICNKTNADKIAFYHGSNTDGWLGKQILLGTELVSFNGKTNEALRVKGLPRPVAAQPAPAPAPVAPPPVLTGPVDAPFDDEIPF